MPSVTFRGRSVSPPLTPSPDFASYGAPPHYEDESVRMPSSSPSFDELDAYLNEMEDQDAAPSPPPSRVPVLLHQPIWTLPPRQAGGHLRGRCSYCAAKQKADAEARVSSRYWLTMRTTVEVLFCWAAYYGSLDIMILRSACVGCHVREIALIMAGIAAILELSTRLRHQKYSETCEAMVAPALVYVTCYLFISF